MMKLPNGCKQTAFHRVEIEGPKEKMLLLLGAAFLGGGLLFFINVLTSVTDKWPDWNPSSTPNVEWNMNSPRIRNGPVFPFEVLVLPGALLFMAVGALFIADGWRWVILDSAERKIAIEWRIPFARSRRTLWRKESNLDNYKSLVLVTNHLKNKGASYNIALRPKDGRSNFSVFSLWHGMAGSPQANEYADFMAGFLRLPLEDSAAGKIFMITPEGEKTQWLQPTGMEALRPANSSIMVETIGDAARIVIARSRGKELLINIGMSLLIFTMILDTVAAPVSWCPHERSETLPPPHPA